MAGKIVHTTIYEAFGERKSLSQWGSDPRCPVTRPGLYRRVNHLGLSIEEAFAHPPNTLRRPSTHKRPTYTAWGESKTMREWAADPRARVSGPRILNRIAKGLSPELAISTPPLIKRHEAFGESKALRAWAIDPRCPVSGPGLYYRVNVLGLSIEQAFTRGTFADAKRGPRRKYKLRPDRGVFLTAWGETKRLQEWVADVRGRVGIRAMLNRIRKGEYTPEQTISLEPRKSQLPPRKKQPRGRKPLRTLTAWGETKTLLHWAADPRAGVGYRALLSRYLRGGFTPEQAISQALK